MPSQDTQVFYNDERGVIDVRLDTGVGHYSGRTLDEIAAEYSGVEVLPIDEAVARLERKYISAPILIDADAYRQGLNEMAPKHWQAGEDSESFQMSEHLSGRVTGVFVRVGEHFLNWNDIAGTAHADLVDKAKAALPGLLPRERPQRGPRPG